MAKSAGSGSGAADFGLLVLRVVLGGMLFFKHGLEKATHFSQMSSRFPNPVHIGSHASLVFALISDAICSLLVVLGLGTRFAAFIIVVVRRGTHRPLIDHGSSPKTYRPEPVNPANRA